MTLTSIKRRLMATVILSQAVLAVGLFLAGVYYTHRRLMGSLRAGMQGRAMSVAALVRYTEDATGNVYFDNTLMPRSVDPSHPDLFAVWTERSGLLTRSDNWPSGLEIPPTGERHWTLDWDGTSYRALRLSRVPVLDREVGAKFQPQTLTIVYVSPTFSVEHQTLRAAEIIALSGLLLLVITVPVALWGIRRGLLPLRHLATQAALVSSQNWTLQLPADAERTEELQPLIESMTTMLARLERSFVQQREFLGNAAHELKTPLAVMKSTLQSLEQRPRSAEEYQAGLRHSLEDLERLERLLQWMLRLARAEQWANGALRRDLPVVDVGATCEEAVERIQPLARTRKTQVQLTSEGPLPLRADPEDLQMVWTNLLENAVRYSPPESAVEVEVGRNNGGPARIVFQDHGPGIPAADLPHVFERFYRGDQSRTRATGGFGLGLAIAKALIEAYGGTIVAESTPGTGTRMTVELPLESSTLQ